MAPRYLLLLLLCLGCHSVPGYVEPGQIAAARALWEQGQTAMRRGDMDQAIGLYERSLDLDPGCSRSHLSLAAAYVDRGRNEEACPHLAAYVLAHPEHFIVRVHYADLLLRLQRLPEARQEYQHFIEDAQEDPETAPLLLVRCHTRLVGIARSQDDDYGEHLNRGIGLYLLAATGSTSADEGGEEELVPEALFCRAAAELKQARELRPGEARPSWYLYEVWRRLGQQQSAQCCLRQADVVAAFTFLTPFEQRRLHEACCLAEQQHLAR